jgi:hypothetical protein
LYGRYVGRRSHDITMADIAIVKAETPAGDRTWLTFADGTARGVPVCVARDLPHFVVESRFGIEDGLWAVVARGGLSLVGRGPGRPGHLVAKAAVSAVVNRWRHGPDTPDGVRARMRWAVDAALAGDRLCELAGRLDDDTISRAIAEVRRLCAEWRALGPGDALRLHWPC